LYQGVAEIKNRKKTYNSHSNTVAWLYLIDYLFISVFTLQLVVIEYQMNYMSIQGGLGDKPKSN